MRIGLDIDNVIADFDKKLLEECKKEDQKKRNYGIVNPYARNVSLLFDWSKEERIAFFAENMEMFAAELEPRKDVKKYMELLLKEGHELYLISNRVYPDYKYPEKTTKKWLQKYQIPYTKLIFSKTIDKSSECIENNIDIMFDDSVRNCEILKGSNVPVCMMTTKLNYIHRGYLPYVRNFKELYERVKDMTERKHIILDTDMANEVDDRFALTYLMSSLDNIEVDAITIAPFWKSGYAEDLSIADGTELSYQTTLKILDMIGASSYKDKVYKGATAYMEEASNNEAVDKIIEISQKNEKTIIVAIGAITNIALAFQREPSIIEKVEIIWLGGNSFLSHQNEEFNFRQDIKAVRTVFESQVSLTVIPCRNVAANLVTTSFELEHYLLNSNIGRYLCEEFKNCKKKHYKDLEDEIGSSKTLWDLSAIGYLLNKDWFVTEKISCPYILENGMYEKTDNRHEVTFVNDLFRNKIFHDYFKKMERYNGKDIN